MTSFIYMQSHRKVLATGRGIALLVFLAGSVLAQQNANVDKKVESLLSQMSLEEKIGQMIQVDLKALRDKADIQKYLLGSVLSGGDSDPTNMTAAGWLQLSQECQQHALQTRLKIPLLYGIDAVHGHNNVDGAVIFPHHIGLGATRNPALVEQAARITAREMAATGIRWTFAPCVAVARDARWGRTYESFGESPDLAAELGAAAIRGFQGRSLSEPTSVLACAKHYVGDGGTSEGIDQGDTRCDEATLRRLHLAPYRAAVKEGVGSIMVSFNSWNGEKLHGHKYLLTDVLKGELGFRGFLISDWAAIDQLPGDFRSDIERSVNAGLDMFMIPQARGETNSYSEFAALLKQLVAEKRVSSERIDDAVRRILRVKFAMGLFDRPLRDASLLASVGSAEHRQVARACVRESLVLLKNEKRALPLSRKLKRLHVAGRAADDLGIQCGGWTIHWQGSTGTVTRGGTTILTAIRNAAPDINVTWSADGSGAAGAQAVIVAVGELPYAEMKGDRSDLQLSENDLAIVKRARQSGAPVITIVLSGRPLVLGEAMEASDAILAAWLPGTEGAGVADVLFGDDSPKGKLPRAWPRSNEQLTLPSDGSSVREPLFPYGFGLVYEQPKKE